MMLLYTSMLYLTGVGLLVLLNDGDIYIGFLWVIDLGVGLIFFIFILHFTSFLYQKAQFNLSARHFIITILLLTFLVVFGYYNALAIDTSYFGDLEKTWFFKVTYLDYYTINSTSEVTELNTLRETYFLLNTFEFFIVNFSLLFGLIASILMFFLLQRVFSFLNYSQIINLDLLVKSDTGFFIRQQNFMTQQSTPAVSRVWVKTKTKNF